MPATPHLWTSRAVRADPEVVWELLVRPEHWPSWGLSVTAVQFAGQRISLGAEGRVRTPLGVWLPFRITAFEECRSWSWAVAGVPATGHRVTADPLGCRAAFRVPALLWPYLLVCQDALRRIARLAEQS